MENAIRNRYDFTLFFDVKDGNPNGDPDAGNLPRTDWETGYGLVTDVCIKRKVRDYVEVSQKNVPGYNIYVHRDVILETQNDNACKAIGLEKGLSDVNKSKGKDPELGRKIREDMCRNFFDVRAFGAVFTSFTKTEYSLPDCNHVRGPIQFGFARSVDPIRPQEITISRLTLSTEDEAAKNPTHTMLGRKSIIPYGLYRMDGYISASLVTHVTGLSEEDLDVFWQALINMFDLDHSASRGNMATRKLIVFKHDSPLGNCPSSMLFERIKVNRVNEGEPARSFKDYEITVDETNLPSGVEILNKF